MPFNPTKIENPYERAFLTWKWIVDNWDDLHPSDYDSALKDSKESYDLFFKAFDKAWKHDVCTKEAKCA